LETAEQELEALKNWWQENGRTLAAGVAIGLGGVFGWTWWQDHLRSQAEEASQIYQRLIEDAAAERHDTVRAQAAEIIQSYPKSGYATFAVLLAAKSAFAENDFEEAKRQLQWVIDNSDNASFKELARLRLARILIDEDRLDDAASVVESVEQEAFRASAEEIRGDIQVIQGNTDGAREAYLQALSGAAISGPTRARVQMKLDDLGSGQQDDVQS
jgi:predicted negative regulator of RcsB-dependent stress response